MPWKKRSAVDRPPEIVPEIDLCKGDWKQCFQENPERKQESRIEKVAKEVLSGEI